MVKEKSFEFWFADGPVHYNEHLAVVSAVNYSQAYKKVKEYIKKHYNWDYIGEHNIRYQGMCKGLKNKCSN